MRWVHSKRCFDYTRNSQASEKYRKENAWMLDCGNVFVCLCLNRAAVARPTASLVKRTLYWLSVRNECSEWSSWWMRSLELIVWGFGGNSICSFFHSEMIEIGPFENHVESLDGQPNEVEPILTSLSFPSRLKHPVRQRTRLQLGKKSPEKCSSASWTRP